MNKHVEFVSYTGDYPCLCMGILTLRIDGKEYTFGDNSSCNYPSFWHTGGSVWFDDECCEHVDDGAWNIERKELPEQFRKYAHEIEEVFNANVEWGCCGGCI